MNLKRLISRRVFLAGSFSLLLSGLLFRVKAQSNSPKESASVSNKPKAQANARLGINFDGISDWSTEQPFVDFFRSSRQWISQARSGWGTGPALLLDEQGWIKELAPNCRATRIISSVGKGLFPSGEYVLLYDGEGELKVSQNNALILKSEPGRLVIKVNSNGELFTLDLVKTNPKNYLRNIRLIASGFEATYANNPWNPMFLKRWSGIACVRFMDLMATNNSTQVSWKNRPTPQDAGFTAKGVPIELLVDLANRLETDAWVCIPHKADDDYVRQLMTYIKAHLKPTSKVWVEYSNEVWNSMFEQSRYAGELGQKMNFSDKPWEAAWKYTAHRSIEVFKLIDQVYVGQAGVVKVLASQAANPYASEMILSFDEAAQFADVLAIAPYVSFNVSPDAVDKISKWNLEQLFDYLKKTSLPESAKWIQDSKKVADKYGLGLVAYEAGQHLVGVSGSENNDQLTKLLHAANADKRMAEIYEKNLADWVNAGGDLMCTFNSMGEWSKWGSWGLVRNNLENPKESPKFSTVIQWAISRGQKMVL